MSQADKSVLTTQSSSHKTSLKRKSKAQLRRQLLSWHKRLGIFSAIFVCLLSLTGILLNHTSELGLAAKTPPSVVLPFYGIEKPVITAAAVGKHWLLHAKSRLYHSNLTGTDLARTSEAIKYDLGSPWAACGRLLGSIDYTSYFIVVCNDSLHLAMPDTELIESIEWPLGHQIFIKAAAKCDELVCLNSFLGLVAYDLEALSYKMKSNVQSLEAMTESNLTWVQALSAPLSLEQAWLANYQGSDISWERLILDIHAGRFLGSLGPWFMDLVAIIFIVLSITGVYLWLKQGRSRS